jgi:hypothetical protein
VNVYAHVDQAAAVVAHGTLAIDRFIRPVPNTIDWSQAPDGRFYPAKAPGAGLCAVPVFFGLYHLERLAGIDPLSDEWFRRNVVLINWVLNALVSTWAVVLLVRLGESVGLARGPSLAGAIAIALGTAYYPYATVYYAHVPAANAVITAAFLIFRPQPRRATDAAAGILAGLAVMFDYPAAFVVISLAMALAVLRPRGLAAFVCGGFLPLSMLLGYHAATFGSPFTTPYAHQNPDFTSTNGSFLTWPSPRVLMELTIGRYRGVFFYSPVLVLGLYGAWAALRGRARLVRGDRCRTLRTYAAVALSVLALWLLLNASYQVWWGGFTAGPRFIIPALVLFAPLVGIGLQRFPRAGFVLFATSVVNYVAITGVWLRLDERYSDPLREVIYPYLAQGRFDRSNVGIHLGLSGVWSLLPPALAATVLVVTSWRAVRTSATESARC